MVIDPNLASIKYQSMTVLLDTVMEAVRTRNRTTRKELYAKAAKIRYLLKSLDYYSTYIDAEKANQILQCLIVTSGIQDYPVPPATSTPSNPVSSSAIKGDKGDQGDRGNDGGATDFAVLANGNVVVDSFALSLAYGARWEYVIFGDDGQRAGRVYATWTADGASIVFNDHSTEDIGTTEDVVVLSATIAATTVRLEATVTSGSWEIRGSRYLIPNQGAAVIPASTPLSDSQIFVGNSSNIATARSMSGDITINTTGVTAISSGVIVNADINASADIEVTKLASLAANNAVVLTNGSGKIQSLSNGTAGQVLTMVSGSPQWATTSGTGTVTSVGFSWSGSGLSFTGPITTSGTISTSGVINAIVGGTGQSFYTQGDLLYGTASNTLNKLPIGTNGDFLTISGGVPAWTTDVFCSGVLGGSNGSYLMSTNGALSYTRITASGLTSPSEAVVFASESSPVGSKGNGFGTSVRIALLDTAGSAGPSTRDFTIQNNWGTVDVNSSVVFKRGTTTVLTISNSNYVQLNNLPTSSAGLPSGTIWNDGGTLKVA